jgi:hypothetical protein
LKRLQAGAGGGLHPPAAEISLSVSPPSPAVKSESSTENITEAAAAAHSRLSTGEGRDFSADEESGALNLTKGSLTITPVTETGGGLKGWSPPSPPAVGGGGGNVASPKSPQGYRPASYNSSDLCVVCGDRASGQYANVAVFKNIFQQ